MRCCNIFNLIWSKFWTFYFVKLGLCRSFKSVSKLSSKLQDHTSFQLVNHVTKMELWMGPDATRKMAIAHVVMDFMDSNAHLVSHRLKWIQFYDSNAPSSSPDKIDKIFFVPDKILFVLDKKNCLELRNAYLLVKWMENDFIEMGKNFSTA